MKRVHSFRTSAFLNLNAFHTVDTFQNTGQIETKKSIVENWLKCSQQKSFTKKDDKNGKTHNFFLIKEVYLESKFSMNDSVFLKDTS